MKQRFAGIVALTALTFLAACALQQTPPATTVSTFDPSRYAGQRHEIAKAQQLDFSTDALIFNPERIRN